MKILNIYCAGKISKNGWRNHFFADQETEAGAQWHELVWPTVKGSVFGHNYVGPYFIGDDHGCFHGDNSHGVGIGCPSGCVDALVPLLTQQRVFDLCLDAIGRCDVLYAFIDTADCFGTIAEIGWAAAKGKRILIAGPFIIADLWFVYQMAAESLMVARDPIRGLEKFVAPVDYRAYINSDEWRQKALAAKERAGFRCQVCNKPSTQTTLDAHHRTYERLGRELMTDITVLCRDCHAKFHDKPVRS